MQLLSIVVAGMLLVEETRESDLESDSSMEEAPDQDGLSLDLLTGSIGNMHYLAIRHGDGVLVMMVSLRGKRDVVTNSKVRFVDY